MRYLKSNFKFFIIISLGLSLKAKTYSSSKLSCSQISDNYCNELYSSENRGNLIRENSQLYLGKTEKGALDAREKLDWEALFLSIHKWPTDLKEALRHSLEMVKKLLQNEEDTDIWREDYHIAKDKVELAIQDFVGEKTMKRLLLQGNSIQLHQTVLGMSEFQKDAVDFRNFILEAQYANHPAWQRIQRLFGEVQRDLVKILQELPFEKSVQDWMLGRVQSVQLTLPYQDNRLFPYNSTRKGCGSDGLKINAYYYRETNSFTICVGYFLSMQSDASLYRVIAHEVAHSFDLGTLAWDHWKRDSILAQANRKFNSGEAFDCPTWKTIVQEALSFDRPLFIERSTDSFAHCLRTLGGHRNLELVPFSDDLIKFYALNKAISIFNSFIDDNLFTLVTQPMVIREGGQNVNNEYYRAPGISAIKDNSYLPFKYVDSYFYPLYYFNQSLTCQKEDEVSEKSFRSSLQETHDITQAYYRIMAYYRGLEYQALADYQVSRPSGENFADWMAIKAIERKLKRIKRPERKNFVQEAMASFCQRLRTIQDSGNLIAIENDAGHLAAIEKEFSTRVHDDVRIRRLSIFTSEVSELVGCFQDQKTQRGIGECKVSGASSFP